MRTRFNKSRRQKHRDIASRRFNVPVRKQGGGARMGGAFRVMMDQLVQGFAGSQRDHGQNQPNQQGGNEQLAELTKMFLLVLQTVCNIANDVPLASDFWQRGFKLPSAAVLVFLAAAARAGVIAADFRAGADRL